MPWPSGLPGQSAYLGRTERNGKSWTIWRVPPPITNQVWLREGITGSGSFLAPFRVNWEILKQRWFLESQCGQQGQKTPNGETRARRFAQMPVLIRSDKRRDVRSPVRERKSRISHKETENTTEWILISYLDDFLSLQIGQIMRFKHQFKSSSID